jgi:4-hydroxybenzoate polyprenyltransferase
VFLAGAVVLFVTACALLNRLTLLLSPLVLAVLLSYPYAKRFTSLCHVWLGLALGLSPVGAWVAVRGEFGPDWLSVGLLGGAVVLWTAGFDVIYAMLDVKFDREHGLFSLPARLGEGRALALSAIFHAGTVGLLVGAGVLAGLGWPWYAGVGLVALLLVYEHWIVRPSDLSRIGTAFFTVNGCVSVLLMVVLLADRLLLA